MKNYVPLSALYFLILACVFFTFYDIVFQRIFWTTLAIYLPCLALFTLGALAWRRSSPRLLFWFSLLLGIVVLAISGYDIYLWIEKEYLWASITIIFIVLLVSLVLVSFIHSKATETNGISNSPEEENEI